MICDSPRLPDARSSTVRPQISPPFSRACAVRWYYPRRLNSGFKRLIRVRPPIHDRQTGCQCSGDNAEGSRDCERPSSTNLPAHRNCGDRYDRPCPRRSEHGQPRLTSPTPHLSPAFPTVSRSPRSIARTCCWTLYLSGVLTQAVDGRIIGWLGDTGGDRVRTIRSAIGSGLAAALAAVMTSPLLGHEYPSPRPPGQRKGSTRTTKCPSCEGTASKNPDDSYSCLKCGWAFDEPPQRE